MAQIALPGIEFMVILQILIIFVSATALLLIDLFIPASQKRKRKKPKDEKIGREE